MGCGGSKESGGGSGSGAPAAKPTQQQQQPNMGSGNTKPGKITDARVKEVFDKCKKDSAGNISIEDCKSALSNLGFGDALLSEKVEIKMPNGKDVAWQTLDKVSAANFKKIATAVEDFAKSASSTNSGSKNANEMQAATAEKVTKQGVGISVDTSKFDAFMATQQDVLPGEVQTKRKLVPSMTVAMHKPSEKVELARGLHRAATYSGSGGSRRGDNIELTEEQVKFFKKEQTKLFEEKKKQFDEAQEARKRKGSIFEMKKFEDVIGGVSTEAVMKAMEEQGENSEGCKMGAKAWVYGVNHNDKLHGKEPRPVHKERKQTYSGPLFSDLDASNMKTYDTECKTRLEEQCMISFSNIKGCKGANDTTSNQDNMTIVLFENGWEFYCVMDGHGPFGHEVSERCVFTLPYFMMQTEFWDYVGTPDSINTFMEEKYDEEVKEMKPQDVEKRYTECFTEMFTEAFLNCQADLESYALKKDFDVQASGTTCIVGMRKNEKLVTAHIGDSRLIVTHLAESNSLSLETEDHKPDPSKNPKFPNKEVLRIEECGGAVKTFNYDDGWSVSRVFYSPNDEFPGLCMTRSFGDVCVKTRGVHAEPEVHVYDLVLNKCPVIFLASDGVWEFIPSIVKRGVPNDSPSDKGVANHLHKKLTKLKEGKTITKHVVKRISEEAKNMWKQEEGDYCDDITMICLVLDSKKDDGSWNYIGSKKSKGGEDDD